MKWMTEQVDEAQEKCRNEIKILKNEKNIRNSYCLTNGWAFVSKWNSNFSFDWRFERMRK